MIRNFRILVLSILFVNLFLISDFVHADTTQTIKPTLTIGSQVASFGDRISVRVIGVNFAKLSDVVAMQFRINYNSTTLRFINYTEDVTGGGYTVNNVGNYVSMVWDPGSSALVLNGSNFFTLNFEVITKNKTNVDLAFSNGVLSDSIGNSVVTNFVNGSISLNPLGKSTNIVDSITPISSAIIVAPITPTNSSSLALPANIGVKELVVSNVSTSTIALSVQFPIITTTNPNSAVTITPPTTASYQPAAAIKFTYTYTNDTGKVAKIKIVRQLLNSKNKVVKSATANKSLKKGEKFTGKINEAMPSNLPAGDYMVKITIYDVKNKIIDQNSFKVILEKKKNKYFILAGEMASSTDVAFDRNSLAKIKSNVKLPTSLKLKYSYTNSTDVKHIVKMIRELVGPNGKIIESKFGKWVMTPGEIDFQTFSQAVSSSLAPGSYQIRIRAYDWTTKELLAENSLRFGVELK